MATHSSILAWKIPWTVEPGRLQCIGSHRAGHDLACMHTCIPLLTNKQCLLAFEIQDWPQMHTMMPTTKNIRIREYEILLIVYLLAFSFGIFINTDYFLKKIINISLSKPLFPCSSPSGHSSLRNQGNAKLVQRAKGLTLINLKFSLWLSGKTCTFLGSPVLFVQVTA